jgi:hypothetical protein
MGAMVVEDRWHLATREQIDTIYETIWDFADWTGVETVCAPGVRIRKEVVLGGGHTSLLGGMITLDDSYLREAELGVRHELCHAWDLSQGTPSLDHPDLFTGEGIEPSALYPTDALRRMESFAEVCQEAPEDDGFARGLDEACEFGFGDPALRWVRAEVYREYQPTWQLAGEVELDVVRVPIEISAPSSWAVGGERLYALQADLGVLAHINPWTGRVLERQALPLSDPEGAHWTMLDGRPAPLLLWRDGGPNRAWLVHAGAALEEVTFKQDASYVFAGVVRDRRAWASVALGSPMETLWEVDLDTGASVAVTDPGGAPAQAREVRDLGHDLLLLLWRGGDIWIEQRDPGEGPVAWRLLQSHPRDCYASLWPDSLAQLSEGHIALLLAGWVDDRHVFIPTVLDLDLSIWRTDPALCGGDGLAPSAWSGHDRRLLQIDGEVWLPEWRDGQPFLTRIGVP